MQRSITQRDCTCTSVYLAAGVPMGWFNFGVNKYGSSGYPESPVNTNEIMHYFNKNF